MNIHLYRLLASVKHGIIDIYSYLLTLFFSALPLKNNRVIIISFAGKGYGDNGRYIAEGLLKHKEIEIYWVANRHFSSKVPTGIKLVRYNSFSYLRILATSKIWINNTRFMYKVHKRKDQKYIQIWHGNLALKKIEFDGNMPKRYIKIMKRDNKLINLMVSNSDFCTNMFKKSFKYDGVIEKYGTARDDIFFHKIKRNEAISRVKDKYDIEEKTKVLTYAPTFRNSYENDPYNINIEDLKETLETITKQKWVILLRLHPLVKNHEILKNKTAINASNYPDMQELICASDIVITDYSSVMFESMIADKSVILYASDIDSYRKERGYYFKFEELPFPIATNNQELAEIINKFNKMDQRKQYASFKKKIGLIEDGKASERIVKYILQAMKDDNAE